VLLEKSVVNEREVPAVADHDVIEEGDAEAVAGVLEALGDSDPLRSWRTAVCAA
jgi:hypothetical protein